MPTDLDTIRQAAGDLGIGFVMRTVTTAKEACDLVFTMLGQAPSDVAHLKLLLAASPAAFVVDVNVLPPAREKQLFDILMKYVTDLLIQPTSLSFTSPSLPPLEK